MFLKLTPFVKPSKIKSTLILTTATVYAEFNRTE